MKAPRSRDLNSRRQSSELHLYSLHLSKSTACWPGLPACLPTYTADLVHQLSVTKTHRDWSIRIEKANSSAGTRQNQTNFYYCCFNISWIRKTVFDMLYVNTTISMKKWCNLPTHKHKRHWAEKVVHAGKNTSPSFLFFCCGWFTRKAINKSKLRHLTKVNKIAICSVECQ